MATLMMPLNSHARLFCTLLAVCGVVATTSCSTDDGLGKRYPVSGTVTYNGKPLERGDISFVPDDPKGIGATGVIENGSYALSTGGGNDGARAGKYKVTITAKEDSLEKAKAAFAKELGKGLDPGYLPGRYVAAAAAKAKSLIPAGYGDVRSTNLTADVKETTNTIPFTLSDAEAPPAPPTGTATGGRGRTGP
jgi:hypothetical protein